MNLTEQQTQNIANSFFDFIIEQRGLIAFYSSDESYKNFSKKCLIDERLIDAVHRIRYSKSKWLDWSELIEYTILEELQNPNSKMISLDKENTDYSHLKDHISGENEKIGILHHSLDDHLANIHAVCYPFICSKDDTNVKDYHCVHKPYTASTRKDTMYKILSAITSTQPQQAAEQLFIDINQESFCKRGQASMSENIIQAMAKVFGFSWQNNPDFPEDQQALSFYFLDNKNPLEVNIITQNNKKDCIVNREFFYQYDDGTAGYDTYCDTDSSDESGNEIILTGNTGN